MIPWKHAARSYRVPYAIFIPRRLVSVGSRLHRRKRFPHRRYGALRAFPAGHFTCIFDKTKSATVTIFFTVPSRGTDDISYILFTLNFSVET